MLLEGMRDGSVALFGEQRVHRASEQYCTLENETVEGKVREKAAQRTEGIRWHWETLYVAGTLT